MIVLHKNIFIADIDVDIIIITNDFYSTSYVFI